MFALAADDAAAGPSAVELARDLLPEWVTWLGVVVFPVCAFLVTWMASEFCFALTWRKHPVPRDAHWTERARAYYVNASALGSTSMVCAVLAAIAARELSSELSRTMLTLATVSTFVAASWGARPVAREFLRRAARVQRSGWREALAHTLIHQLPWLILAALFLGLPRRFDSWTTWASIAFAFGYFLDGGVTFARGLGLARPIDPAFVAGVPGARAERIYVFDASVANAMAFPFPRRILVARRLVEILDPAEIAAILRHEQAHLDESAFTRACRVSIVVAWLAVASMRPLIGSLGTFGVVIVVAAFASLLILGWRANTQDEEHADRQAATTREEAVSHARALEKLHADALLPAVTDGAVTHPDLYERMLAAGVTPEWPRPEPPPRARAAGPLVFAGLLAVIVAIVVIVRTEPGFDRRALVIGLALGGKTPARLMHLAELELEDGTNERALIYASAAVELSPRSASARAVWCTCLVADQEFHRAQLLLDELDRSIDELRKDAGWQLRVWRARRSLELHALVPRGDPNAPS